MSLPSIGARCTKPSCTLNDFLPIRCPHCHQTFCRDHASIDGHGCPSSSASSSSGAQWISRETCAARGCKKPSLASASIGGEGEGEGAGVPAICERCGGAYCASHRQPSTHDCSGSLVSAARDDKNATARALLAKTTAAATTASTGSGAKVVPAMGAGKKDNARTRQVELMRMRQRAVAVDDRGASAVGVDKRRFFKVVVGGGGVGASASEKEFWSTKDAVVGRVVDRLVVLLKVNVGASERVHLIKEDGVKLSLSGQIGDEIEDGAVVGLISV